MIPMDGRNGIRYLLHRGHLLVSAWRLHSTAHRLSAGQSLPETRKRLLDTDHLPTGVVPTDAVWAAGWAGRVGRRLLGRLDSCLTRSLVAGALVADRPGVAVRIGVHRPRRTGDLLDAHGWLTLADRAVGEDAGDRRFEEVMALTMERAG